MRADNSITFELLNLIKALHYVPLTQLGLAREQRLDRCGAHELAEVALGGRVARRLEVVIFESLLGVVRGCLLG